jgi:hypothetical protein
MEASCLRVLPSTDSGQSECIAITKEAAIQRWELWVPMETELYNFLQTAQLCMLQKIHEMFSEKNIPYWLCGGTLIGALRHGGLIPHDDDVDLECYFDDLDEIAAIPQQKPFYMGFIPSKGNWEGHPVAKLEFFDGLLEVDIFPRPNPLPMGERCFPCEAEVFPLQLLTLHNLKVWGPRNPETYLSRCYGPDWSTMVCVYNHDFNWYHGIGFEPRKEVIPLSDYLDIVHMAGIEHPKAEPSAKETFDALMKRYHFQHIAEVYKNYRRQRTLRRNRANAEQREKLREQRRTRNTEMV